VVAWRAWNVTHTRDGWRLRSTHMDDPWPVGAPLEATCHRDRVVAGGLPYQARHAPPHLTCQCGIYGAATPDQALQYYVPSWADISPLPPIPLEDGYVPRAVGRVRLWGRVLECSQGYRATHAYVAQLFLPARRPDGKQFDVADVALDLLAYGVPIELLDVGTRSEIGARLVTEAAA